MGPMSDRRKIERVRNNTTALGLNRVRCGVVASMFLLAAGCGKSQTEPTGGGELEPDVLELPDVPHDAGPPLGSCEGPDRAGTPCDDGSPCTVDDACDGAGKCVGGASRICPESDGNLCTEPRCDAAAGSPESNYCVESPLDGVQTENVCFQFSCMAGKEKVLGPSGSNQCAALEVPKAGCIAGYVCDPGYADPAGTHCKPTYHAVGSYCSVDTAQGLVSVKAASKAAGVGEASVCPYYVCYAAAATGAEDAVPKCVLATTLSESAQVELTEAGTSLGHSCGLNELPEAVNGVCNAWKCGCSDPTCQQAECQPQPKPSMAFKACDNGNACDGSICLPTKDEAALMECAPPVGSEEFVCDLFPEADCDVSGPCDSETGCPKTMDEEGSNAKCQINNHCLDLVNTVCAPNDPNADPLTGCVTKFKPAGTACGEALKDACVLTATCESDGASMICQVNEYVSCNDGNPCTKDFCTEGKCQSTDLPGECDDGNACTQDDLCQSGNCLGAPVSCNDGFDCTEDSCNVVTGCIHTPQDELCNDAVECTDDACVVGTGCQFTPATGSLCSDGDLCTIDDACQDGMCIGTDITEESNVCDGVDNDCDGQTDENCTLVLRSQHTGDGQGVSQGAGLVVKHRLGAPRTFGHAADDTHTLKSGVLQGEK